MAKVYSKMFLLLMAGLLLAGVASAYELRPGATALVTHNIDDVLPVYDPNFPIDPNTVRALNCGLGYYSGNPVGNPYSGGTWGGGIEGGGNPDRVINGVTFYADMWNINDEGRNWNKDPLNSLSDAAEFGSTDDWRFFPERGNLYTTPVSTYGNNDGGISWLANYVSGHQDNFAKNKKWHAPYEGKHEYNTENMSWLTGTDPDSVDSFKQVLRRAGAQNIGGYNSTTKTGERDITYEIAVEPFTRYNVKVINYKPETEGTGLRYEVNGTVFVDKFNTRTDIPDANFIVFSYDFQTATDATTAVLKAGRRTDGGGGYQGDNIGDVSAIIITKLGPGYLTPVADAGPSTFTWFKPTASVTLAGSVTDGTPPVTTLWTVDSGPGTVTFGDATSLTSTAQFSAVGTYTLRLTATDSGNPVQTNEDTVEVVVYADGCEATKGQGFNLSVYDFNEDCITGLADFALFAADWLHSTAQQ